MRYKSHNTETANMLLDSSREYTLRGKTLKKKFSNPITCAHEAYDYARNLYADDFCVYESCFAIFTDNRNQIIGFARIGQGGTTAVVIDVKIICKFAIELLAFGVILVHNHPSGNPSPSSSDVTQTKKLKDALTTLDMHLVDHLILSESSYYSFADDKVQGCNES